MQDLKRLRALTSHKQRKYVRYLRWLLFTQTTSQVHMRFAITQAVILLLMILALPPVDQLPRVIIPLIWMGSFCMALIVIEIRRVTHALYYRSR